VSHPTLGLPPADLRPVFPDAFARLRAGAPRLAARAVEVAIELDPTFRDRYDEAALRGRLRDAELLVHKLAQSVRVDDPTAIREYAEMVAPVYRRKRVPMDDLVGLCEGLRAALAGVLRDDEAISAGRALDDAIAIFRWHRRLAGDARKKNPFLQFIYKGG
jgi:hypothetical protein